MNATLKNPFDFLTFSDPSPVPYAEVYLSGSTATERAGLVRKEILRTGHWPVIPTRGGLIKKPLTIVRDGQSDKDRGIISLNELYENFKKVGQRVQIPLAETDDDHSNQIRENTGFVEELEIEDKGDGAVLVAYMRFTEPEVKDKVLRGTFADVSCGIPFEFYTRGEKYGSVLEHVCITNRPFIDGLGPFLALSDGPEPVQREVSHFQTPEDPTPPAPPAPPAPPQVRVVDPFGGLSIREVIEKAREVLTERQQKIYKIVDVKASGIVINDDEREESFRIPFKVEDGKLVSSDEGWKPTEYQKDAQSLVPEPQEEPPAPPEPVVEEPPAKPESSGDPLQDELETARRNRNLRMGVAASTSTTKEGNMPLTREELEALNLSAMPEGQRTALQKLLDENVTLSASSREAQVGERVTELENKGLKGKPGALKLYRRIALADDGGPAVVVLSDDGQKKESMSALSILDQFIESIQNDDGKIALSDQAPLVPDDPKPPITPSNHTKPIEERLADAKAALAGVHGS